jgi:ABC-type transport system substrate-binding protein
VPEDIVPTKRELPDLLLALEERFSSGTNYLSFGYEGTSPFKDVRVRQAFSMLLDSEAFADAIENAGQFRDAGIEPPIARPTVLYPGHGDYWLDPNDVNKFGPTHKYLKYNPQEAKSLLTAAGHPNGFDFEFTYVGDGRYGNVYPRVAQVIAGMLTEGGLRPQQNPMQYQLYYDNYFLSYVKPDGKGFNGLILRTGRGFPTAALQYQGQVHGGGSVHHGSTPTGLNAKDGDPKVNALIEKMRQEFDFGAQQAISHEIIKYYTQQAYTIARPTISIPYTLVWPVIGNYKVWEAWSNTSNVEQAMNWWIDDTKKPLAKT